MYYNYIIISNLLKYIDNYIKITNLFRKLSGDNNVKLISCISG